MRDRGKLKNELAATSHYVMGTSNTSGHGERRMVVTVVVTIAAIVKT